MRGEGTSAVCMYTYIIITMLFITHVIRECSELEDVMQTLQKYLEEECDAYFVKIEEHAVKVPSITDLKVANLTLQLHAVGIFSDDKVQLHSHRKQSGGLEAMLCTAKKLLSRRFCNAMCALLGSKIKFFKGI